jgi:hypothetical protein
MTSIYALISRGYFPVELPPPFTTESFANYVNSNRGNLPANFTNHNKTAKLLRHSIPRVGISRRRVSVPNPICFYDLCQTIENNWPAIRQQTSTSKLSKSYPKVGTAQGRAIVRYYMDRELTDFRIDLRSTSRYILVTDIAQFYPSLYTHSIPWAVHGKPFAKRNRSIAHFGNLLDKCVSNGQDGQTAGIPIGPDTSLVLAELVLSAFDNILVGLLPNQRMFRYVDDFEIGCKSHSEAEEILALIQETLNEFELQINLLKTKILELPVPLNSPWVTQLRHFPFRDTLGGERSDLVTYFDAAFRLASENPDDHVLKYAIKRLGSIKINPKNWYLVENFLLQSVMVEPGVFLAALSELINQHKENYTINIDSLREVINFQIAAKSPLGQVNEVAWALWAAIFWNIEIDEDAAKALSNVKDSFVALLSLDADNSGLIPSGLDTTNWKQYMVQPELYGSQWLLAYEANLKGWLPSKSGKDYVSSELNFQHLKNAGVEFYSTQRARTAVPTGATESAGLGPMFSF